MIEIKATETKSCNTCPSQEAVVKICFVLKARLIDSSTNIRLCQGCLNELEAVLAKYRREEESADASGN